MFLTIFHVNFQTMLNTQTIYYKNEDFSSNPEIGINNVENHNKIYSISSLLSHNSLTDIVINKNSDFASLSSSGNGTKGNPYLLENSILNSANIQITQTTSYFIIENLIASYSISIQSASNGIIENCTFSQSYLNFQLTNNMIIQNNSFYSSVYFSGDANNTFSNNYIINNYKGFPLWQYTGGVYLIQAIDFTITDNTFIHTGLYFWGAFPNESQELKVENNTVDKKPLRVYQNEVNKTISAPSGQVILLNCSLMTIENLSISDNIPNGIEILFGMQNTIRNVQVSNAYVGYDIPNTDSIVFENDTSSNNSVGFSFEYVNNITIINCIASNANFGFDVYSVGSGTFINNIASNNSNSGFYLSTGTGTFINNTAIGNKEYGFYVKQSVLIDNLAYFNHIGFDLEFGFNSLESSSSTFNDIGINLFSSNYNTISNNNIYNNGLGLNLNQSSQNMVINNTVIQNNGDGINVYASSNNSLEYNLISNNQHKGIIFNSASFNLFDFNTIVNNTDYGIYLSQSNDNDIYLNNFISNHLLFGNSQGFSDTNTNSWSNGTYGNFWNDYCGSDINGDNIGDIYYGLDGSVPNVYDILPLIHPIFGDTSLIPTCRVNYTSSINSISTTTSTSIAINIQSDNSFIFFILLILAIAGFLGVVYYTRKRNNLNKIQINPKYYDKELNLPSSVQNLLSNQPKEPNKSTFLCKNCFQMVNSSDMFCSNCGERLK